MPIQTSWVDDEKTLLHFEMTTPWGWDDMFGALEDIQAEQEAQEHTVVWLFDVRKASLMAPDAFGQTRVLEKKRPKNTHPVYIVLGGNMLIQSLGSTFMKVFGRNYETRFEFVDTMEEALRTARDFRQETS